MLPASLLVLVRSKKPVEGSDVVFEDVRMLTSRDAFRHVLDGQLPRTRLRAFAGHAGWGPGQLEAEIARGDWIVMPAKADQVFSETPQDGLARPPGARRGRMDPAPLAARRVLTAATTPLRRPRVAPRVSARAPDGG